MIPQIWQTSGEFSLGRKLLERAAATGPAPALPEAAPEDVLGMHPDRELRLAAQKGIGVLSSASYAVDVLAEHVKVYRDAIKDADPVGRRDQRLLGQQRPLLLRQGRPGSQGAVRRVDENLLRPRQSPTLRAASTPTRNCWKRGAACRSTCKADFGRWLRQSDEDHQAQAAEVRHIAGQRTRRGPCRRGPARRQPPR